MSNCLMPFITRLAKVFVVALLATAAAEPEKVTRVTDFEVSVAPDNKRIVFISNRDGRFKLYTMGTDGRDLRQLTNDDATDDNPAWSPDSRWIAYVSNRNSNTDVYIIAADGSSNRRVTTHAGIDIHPSWSPDGRRLLFTSLRNSRRPDDPQLDLYVINADGSEERKVTSGPITSFGSWSPDGSQMAYWRMFDGNAEIALADRSGRLLKRLTNDPAFDGWPSWSPDGRWIAFARERGEDADIHVVDRSGNERLVAGGVGRKTGPRWSADGKSIYFSRRLDGEVRIWRIAVPWETEQRPPRRPAPSG